ncbi:MAG: hypothetical protein KF770_31195 [Anaerolineae bacterium]|nr:hypothetical protein [Anaerolineae bacterium]
MMERFFFGNDDNWDDDDWDDDDWDDEEGWDDEEWDDEEFDGLPTDLIEMMQAAQAAEVEQLDHALRQLTVKDLRQIAQRRGWRLMGTAKDDLVEQMQTLLLEARQDPYMLAGLSEKGRELLAAAHTLFNINNTIFQDQWEYLWREVLKHKEPMAPAVQELENYGLIYRCRSHGEDVHHHPILNMPEYLLPVVALIPRRKASISPLKRSLPAARPFLENVEAVVNYLAAGGLLRLTSPVGEQDPEGHHSPWVGNWPYLPEEVKKLSAYNLYRAFYEQHVLTVPIRRQLVDVESCPSLVTAVGDANTLSWILSLLQGLQVLTMDETLTVLLSPERWNMLVSLPRQQLLGSLYQIWGVHVGDVWELRAVINRAPDMTIWRLAEAEMPYQALLMELIVGRQTVLRLLRGLAEDEKRQDEWFSLSDFVRELYQIRPTLFYNMLTPEAWGFRQGGQPFNPEKEGDWLKTSGQMVRAEICGPMYWMNMVELRGSPDDVVAFRLTDTGRFLLSPAAPDTAVPQSTSPGEAIWLDDRTVQISPGYEMGGFLALMTQLGTAVPNQPFTYRLDGAGLEKAFIAGESPDTLNRIFLESGWRLPDAGLEYLEEVYRRFGLAHLYDDLTVIEFSDDMALPELRAAGLLDDCLVHEFSHRLIAIRPEMVPTLLTRLEGRGYTPRVTEAVS